MLGFVESILRKASHLPRRLGGVCVRDQGADATEVQALINEYCHQNGPGRDNALLHLLNVMRAYEEEAAYAAVSMLCHACHRRCNLKAMVTRQLAALDQYDPETAKLAFSAVLSESIQNPDEGVRKAACNVVDAFTLRSPTTAAKVLIDGLRTRFEVTHVRGKQLAVHQLGRLLRLLPERTDAIVEALFEASDQEYLRSAAMYELGRALTALPERAEEITQELLHWCDNGCVSVKCAAMRQLVTVAQACPDRSADVAKKLCEFCSHSAPLVRRTAMEQVPKMIKACPERTEELLKALLQCRVEGNICLETIAIGAFEEAAESCHIELQQLLGVRVFKGCCSRYVVVRATAVEGLVALMTQLPERGDYFADALQAGCSDEDEVVRSAAMRQLVPAMKACPRWTSALLGAVMRGCSDASRNVRYEAVRQVAAALEAFPELCPELRREVWQEKLYSILFQSCGDEDVDVARTAKAEFANSVNYFPEIANNYLHSLEEEEANSRTFRARQTQRTSRRSQASRRRRHSHFCGFPCLNVLGRRRKAENDVVDVYGIGAVGPCTRVADCE